MAHSKRCHPPGASAQRSRTGGSCCNVTETSAAFILACMPFFRRRNWVKISSSILRPIASIWSSIRMAPLTVLCLAGVFLAVAGQPPGSDQLPGSTEDHVAATGWWPTKSTSSASAFAGDSACAKCHSQEFSSQAGTAMAKAASRVSTLPRSAIPTSETFQSGSYFYRFIAADPGFSLEVKSNDQSISARVTWIFGAGVHGQTYLVEDKGGLYESQVSTFSSVHDMNLTPGHTQALEGSIQNALGNRLSTQDAARCFACHSTAWSVDGKLDVTKSIPGVRCEACHGPGVDHINAVSKVQTEKALTAILNPAHLTPANSVDFCGACHRTMMDVVLNGSANGLSSIRFQPYRLQKSRCWEKTEDSRLTCIACHNPHEPLVRDASLYDQKCLTCHSVRADVTHAPTAHRPAGSPLVCPKATTNCTTCHMPKYNLPEMHSQFTDHFIRVVRPGERYPN